MFGSRVYFLAYPEEMHIYLKGVFNADPEIKTGDSMSFMMARTEMTDMKVSFTRLVCVDLEDSNLTENTVFGEGVEDVVFHPDGRLVVLGPSGTVHVLHPDGTKLCVQISSIQAGAQKQSAFTSIVGLPWGGYVVNSWVESLNQNHLLLLNSQFKIVFHKRVPKSKSATIVMQNYKDFVIIGDQLGKISVFGFTTKKILYLGVADFKDLEKIMVGENTDVQGMSICADGDDLYICRGVLIAKLQVQSVQE